MNKVGHKIQSILRRLSGKNKRQPFYIEKPVPTKDDLWLNIVELWKKLYELERRENKKHDR